MKRSQKVILEIDGPYHTEKTKAKEQLRDDIAIASFGADWEVLRISTDDINQNITNQSDRLGSLFWRLSLLLLVWLVLVFRRSYISIHRFKSITMYNHTKTN